MNIDEICEYYEPLSCIREGNSSETPRQIMETLLGLGYILSISPEEYQNNVQLSNELPRIKEELDERIRQREEVHPSISQLERKLQSGWHKFLSRKSTIEREEKDLSGYRERHNQITQQAESLKSKFDDARDALKISSRSMQYDGMYIRLNEEVYFILGLADKEMLESGIIPIDLHTTPDYAGMIAASIYIKAFSGAFGKAKVKLETETSYSGMTADSVYIAAIMGHIGDLAVNLRTDINHSGMVAGSVYVSRFYGYIDEQHVDIKTSIDHAGMVANSVYLKSFQGNIGDILQIDLTTTEVDYGGMVAGSAYEKRIQGKAIIRKDSN